MNAIKVGISNLDAKTDRMKAFKMNGWQIHKKYDFATGVDAVRLEADIKRWLRKELKIPIFLSKKQMPKTGGHSETISSDYLTVLQINQKVIELIKGYRNNP